MTSKNTYSFQPLKGNLEKGTFNRQAWLEEADAHLLSAKLLHSTAEKAKEELIKTFDESLRTGETAIIATLSKKVESHSKSAILLLGYAVEAYLKSGLVRLYQFATRKDFQSILIKRYSHDLNKAAKDLGIQLPPHDREFLSRIKTLVLDEARYPVTPKSTAHYVESKNRISDEIWSSGLFPKWISIAEAIRDKVVKIDFDSSNPAIMKAYNMGPDGYFIVRFGGNLPSYLIAKFPQKGEANGISNFDEIKDYFSQLDLDVVFRNYVLPHWDALKTIDINKYTNRK